MKWMFALLVTLAFSPTIEAKTYQLQGAEVEYTVKHLMKTVKGKSRELKGKMVCEKSSCDFLVAIPVVSFISGDSNRDLNLQTIFAAQVHPFITVKGKFPETVLSQKTATIKAKVSAHGVEKEYNLSLNFTERPTGSLVFCCLNMRSRDRVF